MGFEFTNNSLGSVKQIQFELDSAALLLNSYALPIKPSKAIFIGGYIITSGGTIPLNVASFDVRGNSSNFGFLRTNPTSIAAQDVLYKLRLFTDQVFTPQTPETYTLQWTYSAGDGRAKVIILYSEYL